jgi:hypothetical protein
LKADPITDARPGAAAASPTPIEPATVGPTAAAHLTLIVNCRQCHRQAARFADLVARYGPHLTLPDWAARLVCSSCGSRDIDFVVFGSGNRTGIGQTNPR